MSLRTIQLSLVVLLLYNRIQPTAQQGHVYEYAYFSGKSTHATFIGCLNYIPEWDRATSSLVTNGHCVRFYDQQNCNGKFIEVSSRSPHAKNLADWKFDNLIRSHGPCSQSCPLQLTESEAHATIFTQKAFRGDYHEVNIRGCTLIPTEYHNQTKSILTNGYCIQIYNTEECIYESNTGTIEVKPETPYHDDISTAWNFPVAKAISRCDYKCLNISFVKPKEGDVVLFQSKEYKGNKYNFSMLGTNCIELPTRWRGLAESIGLGVNTCVILFDRRRCSNRQHEINDSVSDLNTVNFGGQIRSLRACNLELFLSVSSFATSTTFIPTSETSYTSNYSTEIPTSKIRNTFAYYTTEIPTKVDIATEPQTNNRKIRPEAANFSPVLISVLVLVPLAAVFLSVVVVFCLFRHCSPYIKDGGRLSEKEIREFLSGMGVDLLANGDGSTKKENDYSTEFLAQNNAYNMEYEIARSCIEIDYGALLGSGEFGMVYKGKLDKGTGHEEENSHSTSRTEKHTVAIKTVNPSSGLNALRSLLKEVKVMLFMGHHANIAQLIGCCTDKIREGDIMVVLEYCSEGSLESYLQKNRSSFNNLVNKGKLELDTKTTTDITDSEQLSFDTQHLVQWGLEIAGGMEFLSNAKVVHSDLAARNILLNDQLVAKISDFGLSRQLYAYSQYMKKHQEPLPFRWMAIESLKCLEFSTKSDVWSYGVLLWEIFSLGEKPYPGLGWNEAFISNLESGLRLAKPKNSTNEIYNLMLRCWDENPAGRPSFAGIVEEIQEMKTGFMNSIDTYTDFVIFKSICVYCFNCLDYKTLCFIFSNFKFALIQFQIRFE